MIVLYVFLGILIFLFLLTLIPLRFDLSFRQEFFLTVRFLFFSFSVLPGKEKEESEQEEEESEQEKKTGSGLQKLRKILKQNGFKGFLNALFELVKQAASSSKSLLSHLKWRKFDLYLCVAGKEDAAEAALLYGRLSAAVYAACGFLFGLTGCRQKAVTVDLDYQAEENLADFSAKFSILPLFLIKEGISLLIHSMPLLRMFQSSGRQTQKRKVTGNE